MADVYFISGHLDLTDEEFVEQYVPRLNKALGEGASFVVGDARGADQKAQAYLARLTKAVTVYHMFESPRNNEGFPTSGGFTSDDARDTQMTKDSTRDIAWVRPGRERSGTQRNLNRRIKPGQIWQDEDGGVSVILWVKEDRVCYDYRQSDCDSRHYPCYSSLEGFMYNPPTLLTDRDQALYAIPGELKAMAEAFYGEDPEVGWDEEEEDE